MFEEGELSAKDPNYVFCPAAHRKQLLHLFTKHFCTHTLFPGRDGVNRTSSKIECDAVYEMYTFCTCHGLTEVWAYMWNCWYCPKMWRLWARSTTPFITWLRTMMNVENFWKQLKHDWLHWLLHPRLDHLIYILIYHVTPVYLHR
ncbi:hypothetical protein EDD18DRAFT_1077894, partial [Armillaria luteobubalina]